MFIIFFLKSVCLNLLSCTTVSYNETIGLGQDINICAAKVKRITKELITAQFV